MMKQQTRSVFGIRRFAIGLGMVAFVSLATFLAPVAKAAEAPLKKGNLLKNPSFTEGLAEWKIGVSPADNSALTKPEIDQAVFRGSDMASLKLSPQTGMRLVCLEQSNIPRDPRAKKYRVSGWRRCQGVPAGWESGICLKWSGTQSHCVSGNEWVREIVEIPAPAGTNSLSVQIYLRTYTKPEEPPAVGGGTVWYDDISLEPIIEGEATSTPGVVSETNKIAVTAFYPLGEKGLFVPGQPVQLSLNGKNNEAVAAELEIEFQVKDFWGAAVGQKIEKIAVATNGEFKLTIELPAPVKQGFFSVTANIKKNGALVAWQSTGFCVIQPPTEKDPYFGMDANTSYDGLIKAFGMIGVGTLGIYQTWAVPDDAVGKESEYMRKRWETYWEPFWKSDFTLVGFVKTDPGFHAKRHKDETLARKEKRLYPYPDSLFKELGDAVAAEAEVMKDRIKTWIICEEIDAWVGNPNAPAGSGTCELARHILMTRIAYEQLKKAIPDSLVAGLTVSCDYATDPPYQLVRRVLPELKNYVDAIGVHPYCGNYEIGKGAVPGPEAGRLRETLLTTQKLQAEWGKTKTIVIPEKGMGVPYHVPPDHMYNRDFANLTARNMIVAKTVAPVIFHSLHVGASAGAAWRIKNQKMQSTDENPLMDFGLWRITLDANNKYIHQPRSAVAAYATVARMLANATDIDPMEVNVRKGFYTYIFKKKDVSIIVAWTTDKEPYKVTIKLPVVTECIDLMGNSRSLPAGDAQLDISESPIFLACKTDPKVFAGVMEKTVFPSLPSVLGEAHLSDLSTLTFYLINQTRQELEAEIEADPLKTVRLKERNRKVKVPAEGRVMVDFAIAKADPAKLKDEVLKARIKADGQTVDITSELGVMPVARAPDKMKVDGDLSKYAGIQPVVLDSPAYVSPPMAQMPESHLWKGADDLSVKCWLTWDEKNFYIAAQVADDIHIQRQAGVNIWMDDCLQFAFDTKNDGLKPATTRNIPSFGRDSGYDDNDYNLGMALASEGPMCYAWVEKGKTKKAGPRNFPLVVKRDGNMTVYEMAIPWENLAPLEPRAGRIFGFSFLVFDSDKTEDSQAAYFMALTPGIAGGQDPSAYKKFVLIKQE